MGGVKHATCKNGSEELKTQKARTTERLYALRPPRFLLAVSQTPPRLAVVMLITGILNPAINSLLSRVRHTNTLVIADRGFPFWPQIETVDISLVDDVPTVLEVLSAIRPNFRIGQILMAKEFLAENSRKTRADFVRACSAVPVAFEPHVEFKKRVPQGIGLIRTGDTTQYANMILVSA
jgi:D-ribose pyranase